jgi:hypothetical protein
VHPNQFSLALEFVFVDKADNRPLGDFRSVKDVEFTLYELEDRG